MIKQNQNLMNALNLLSDIVLTFLAYLLAMFLRFNVLNGQRGENLLSSTYLLMALVYSVLMALTYYALQVYTSHRFKRAGSEITLIFFVNAIGELGLMAVLYVFRLMNFPRLAVFLFWLSSSLLVAGKHTMERLVLRYCRKKGLNQKHVLVVGNGRLAHQYMENIKAEPELGFTVAGYVSAVEKPELGRCFGRYEQLSEILEQHDLDEVVVALEPHEAKYMSMVLAAADKEGARISIIPFYNEYIPAHPTIDVVGDTKLIDMRATPLNNLGWAMVKRGMDVVGSLVLILLTSPIMAAVAIGVKLSSPGPILFRQERVGLNKKVFKMLKFRSMRITGTEDTGWSKDSDPRKTKFGSFIRKCSIDELPQFFNVLKGEMSLIGPRPEVPFHVEHFKEEIPLYLVRQQVRPGITGWAQVNGLRGDTSIEERVKYDIWYIENWSIGLDILILFKTVFGGMINSEKITPETAKSQEKTRV